jgi:putative membrane protein
MEAAAGGMAEVQLGKLAADKASNGDVKRFAQMMVDDHTKANDELMQIAKDKQLMAPHALKPEAQAAYDRLSKLSGEQFDHAYMQHMVEDHQKDVALFKKQSQSASDPQVKQFASSTLPTLQKHLQDARDISAKVAGPRGTSGTTRSGTTGSGDGNDKAGAASGKPKSGSGATSGTGSSTGAQRPPER